MQTTVTNIHCLPTEDYIPLVFERHSKPLFAMAEKWCSRTKFRWDSKEMMNELYLIMWDRRETVRAGYEKKGAPYLYKMMNNMALEKIRGARQSHLPIEEVCAESFASDGDKNAIIYKMETDRFLESLNRHKDKMACEIVKLRIQGFKPAEIADKLKISVDNLHVRFSRFKPTLKKLWKAAFGTDIPKNWKI